MALTHRTKLRSSPAAAAPGRTGGRAGENGGAGNGHGPTPADLASATTVAATSSLAEDFGGGRLLMGDMRTGWLLVNGGRHAVMQRLFALSAEQEKLLTAVLVLMLADGLSTRIRRMLLGPPVPSLGDSFLGATTLSDLVSSVGGPVAQATPMSAPLLTLAVLGGAAGPVAVRSVRAMRSGGHDVSVHFHHRYGYLVDPGHWRQRRAQRRMA